TLAFRRANRDFSWYMEMYKKYSSLPGSKDVTEATLRPIWTQLVTQVKAWPDNNVLTANDFNELVPIYKAVDDIKQTPKLSALVAPGFAHQAMKGLGRQGL